MTDRPKLVQIKGNKQEGPRKAEIVVSLADVDDPHGHVEVKWSTELTVAEVVFQLFSTINMLTACAPSSEE